MKEKLKILSLADLILLRVYFKSEPSFQEDPQYQQKLSDIAEEILNRLFDLEIITNEDNDIVNSGTDY